MGHWVSNNQLDDGVGNSDRVVNVINTDDQLYWDLKASLAAAELLLLRGLGFDTNVELAYVYVVLVLEDLWSGRDGEYFVF